MTNPDPSPTPLAPQGYFVCKRFLWWAVFALFIFVACWFAVAVALHNAQDRFNAASCANHFRQLCNMLAWADSEYPDFILPANSDTRQALSAIFKDLHDPNRNDLWLSHSASACPESFRRDGSIGYIYVGDGLRLGDVSKNNILILFCPATSHRRSDEHCHAWLVDNHFCVSSNSAMIETLKNAISRGESREAPYSPRALAVLRSELAARLDTP